MYSPHQAPPVPPPKPYDSNDPSRISTPASNSPSLRPPPQLPPSSSDHALLSSSSRTIPQPQPIPDPGPQWLPKYLQDKAKPDLATLLQSPPLLNALVHSPQTIHPSLSASHQTLQTALSENVALASHLLDLEKHVVSARAATSAQLLSARALERQWRAKQGEMDAALAPFAPASLYQRLAAGVSEQEGVCRALEESFLAGEGGGDDDKVAGEREVAEWARSYREAKKLAYLRRERRERWDEGRVGGWR
ncbi:hypothetical protein GE09DRAFT_1125163 [Coniochaeta sp. 2T2.1]|nr:hypothetical protein GE09DRAFT_1125163 [Coniochaeta sp. 2T2.1]